MIARDNRDELATPSGAQSLRGRLWRYGPLVVWLGVICFTSTGNLSAENTSRIVRPLVLWLFPETTEAQLLQIHFVVRKTAHFSEYAVLALLAARAFLSSSRARLRRRWLAASLALVVACALLDEYQQSRIPALRTGSIYDSMIDIAGGAFALTLLHQRRSRQRRKVK